MVPFTKMHGNGNDFLVLENLGTTLEDDLLSALATALCERRHSLGADGILVVEPFRDGKLRMRIFNADGSEGEMCGNGARCFARYAAVRKLAPPEMTFETLAGPITANVTESSVIIGMGKVSLKEALFDHPWTDGERDLPLNALTVGVPHCVVFPEHPEEWTPERITLLGRSLDRPTPLFPSGTNVNVATRLSSSSLRATTYERGVNAVTRSCGTGSIASALVAARLFGMASPIRVENPGGVNTVHFEESEEKLVFRIRLEGKTTFVAEGMLSAEGLRERLSPEYLARLDKALRRD
jgi:diaminopimelate epimerase